MPISKILATTLALVLMGGAATSALASGADAPIVTPSDLPPGGATYGVSDYTPQFNFVSGSGTGSVTLGNADAGAATLIPEVSASGAIGAGTPENQLTASATLRVNFYINGAAGALVPIVVQGEAIGSGSGFGLSSAGAYLESYDDDGRDAVTVYSFRNCNSASCGGSFDRTFDLSTGEIYTVLLEAGGYISSNLTATTSGPGAFSASVDPPNLIVIAPTFAAANPGFSLAINSGDAPAPGVPESASWALMIGGFGFAGAALRSSRKRKSVAA